MKKSDIIASGIDLKNPFPEFEGDGKTNNQRHDDWNGGYLAGIVYSCKPGAGDILAGVVANAILNVVSPSLLRDLERIGVAPGHGLIKR